MRPRELVQEWVEAFNRHDADALARFYAEDAVNHQVAEEPVQGREAIRAMFAREFAAATMVCIPEHIFEDGEWAILEWRDPLGLRGCGFFHVREGQIIFQRGYWDKLSYLRVHGLPMPDFLFDRQPVLVGELLELRPLRADDFEALFRVASDPLIWEQHPERNRYEEATFRAFFEEALKSGGALVAVDRASGRIIGSSRFHGYDADRSVVEIGWSFLAREYWGGRYNGEMKRLMLEHAFRWVNRVVFIIGPDNRRSQRAVEKIGGVRAGTITDAQGRERVVYELTPALYARRLDDA